MQKNLQKLSQQVKNLISFLGKKPVLILLGLVFAVLLFAAIFNHLERAKFSEEDATRHQAILDFLKPNNDDPVYGNKDAEVKLILYSDTDCQYCRQLYPTLKELVDEYPNNSVALVYRHLPIYFYRGEIDNSERLSTCLGEKFGDKTFFAFLDNLFARLPSGVQTDAVSSSTLITAAVAADVTTEETEHCLQNYQNTETIKAQHESGGTLGVVTIPYVFVVEGDIYYEITGRYSKEVYSRVIDEILKYAEQ